MSIVISGTTGIDLGHTPASNVTDLEVEGNLNITGVGARITGDFSNAILNNRTMFQCSVPNGNTGISLIPNGTSTVAMHQYNTTPDVYNSSVLQVGVDGTICRINSFKNGTGTDLPIVISTVNTERMRIDTSGNVLVTGSGALGYGTGSGITVVQPSTSGKSTAVTANKSNGQIIMNGATLATGASVLFPFYNSVVNFDTDQVFLNIHSVGSGYSNYRVENAGTIGGGGIYIKLTNTSGVSLSDAPSIKFTVIKGAVS